MKLYIANEAKLIAKNVNRQQHKTQLDSLLGDVMYLVNETAKRGEYEMEFELGEQSTNLSTTFDVTLREMGYQIFGNGDKRVIKWG